MLRPGDTILRDKYILHSMVTQDNAECTVWECSNSEDSSRYLARIWSYGDDRPDFVQRALWDAELRIAYRLGSSADSEDILMNIHDSGIDMERRCFVMVMEGIGYKTLASALVERGKYAWLHMSDRQHRCELWKGLKRVYRGIRLLHNHNILHRNVGADCVYLNREIGPSSLRLGGFEWSIRIGAFEGAIPPTGWSIPPEVFSTRGGYGPESDIFAFGMLVARCFVNIENFAQNDANTRLGRVIKSIEASSSLGPLEKEVMCLLINRDPANRASNENAVLEALDRIVYQLGDNGIVGVNKPLVVVFNPRNTRLVERALATGFIPTEDNSTSYFNPNDFGHVERLRMFVQSDLCECDIYATSQRDAYVLVGGANVLKIVKHERWDVDTRSTRESWECAFCIGPDELKCWDKCQHRKLPKGLVSVRTVSEYNGQRSVRQNAQSWERWLPLSDEVSKSDYRPEHSRFLDFILLTNHLEYLIRDAELFEFSVVEVKSTKEGRQELVIQESQRERPPFSKYRIEGGLIGYLRTEEQMRGGSQLRLILTALEEDSLFLDRKVEESDCWTLTQIIDDKAQVRIARMSRDNAHADIPQKGFIRTFGMFGQVELIRRRLRAISRLKHHSYLLRAVLSPGQVYMDSGGFQFRKPLPGNDKLDEAKRAAISDILRVRPIYSLQGPPGTGKTTLVAHLLRQILEDDPVAQVLVTAQAHGAVDVLRERVDLNAFEGVAGADLPLTIRLGGDLGPTSKGTVSDVAFRILESSSGSLRDMKSIHPIQSEWLTISSQMTREIAEVRDSSSQDNDTRLLSSEVRDFFELIRRGANVTYCTATSRDLEDLADLKQSFDWSIIEEAGKIHGFELALPMQAGHRWLLIGDHVQLAPYRYQDYYDGIQNLQSAIDALVSLPNPGRNASEWEWLRSWEERNSTEIEMFKEYAQKWIKTFEQIHYLSSQAKGHTVQTTTDSVGAASGLLVCQHRMHPTIGTLISDVFYAGKIQNMTIEADNRPVSRVTHDLSSPAEIEGKALVWLDLPWSQIESNCGETGPESGGVRYRNAAEARAVAWFIGQIERRNSLSSEESLDLAILAPYSQQVYLIAEQLKDNWTLLGNGLIASKINLKSRLTENQSSGSDLRYAHTVDSFQGNQADIVIVSLVRNNDRMPPHGLGFLEEAPRMNVLLSRAERLLVLVGSWDFFCHQSTRIDELHPASHWPRIIDVLSSCFDDGTAVRIDVPDIVWREL